MSLFITKIKIACLAIMLVFTMTSTFIANRLWVDLKARNERIVFLEARLQENSESFTKLQNSCYASQKISEEAAMMSDQMARNTDELQAEIERLRARIVPERQHQANSEAISDEQQKDIPTYGVTNENGKQGQKARSNAGNSGAGNSSNPKLDPALVRVLDRAYCTATADSVYCTAK